MLLKEQALDPIKTKVLANAIDNKELPFIKTWNNGKWQFPAHVTADIGHESDAGINEVKAGLRTRSDWFGEQGKDYHEQAEVIMEETKINLDMAQELSSNQPPIQNNAQQSAPITVKAGRKSKK